MGARVVVLPAWTSGLILSSLGVSRRKDWSNEAATALPMQQRNLQVGCPGDYVARMILDGCALQLFNARWLLHRTAMPET
ncbi:uncharacterized protein C8Q71DRAFT_741632 [Rhodofomes roseus]|uniref:Uncharacterized protein n=1 Tax=Rhodofomes roseus TaxID=34475 RepID=A0ABQ8KQE8_9APHY|nr:uncharacterized protein C8Q71DRAFT_741632 [Rhodofomes roseus]KAH9840844.1 hypothetical protein C8Q71DRAFT_741632 [Rhodofomes roseus]